MMQLLSLSQKEIKPIIDEYFWQLNHYGHISESCAVDYEPTWVGLLIPHVTNLHPSPLEFAIWY